LRIGEVAEHWERFQHLQQSLSDAREEERRREERSNR
jgi:hypothetical protein